MRPKRVPVSRVHYTTNVVYNSIVDAFESRPQPGTYDRGPRKRRYVPEAHHTPQPHIESGPTRHLLPCTLHLQRTAKLAELPVVVVDQKLGLFLEAGVPDLLLRPLERRVLSHVEVDELSTLAFA